ncbi:hypothetical protein [Streptomyces rhizosphaerihabitans]|uniref:hypothetical protein n=1 Tax=Streptomyces rhizosphaerihabitans TaxID=1266770 RepID=UPI0021C01AE3|nr:hypothetical protein [Streptomyces rhizosphaerihabitans]MCT9005444.1 hypothetical protein [Streptomyces rhizosphaerihabitans]
MQMSETYAESIAVVLPVILLAAVVEMRAFEQQTRTWWAEITAPFIEAVRTVPGGGKWTDDARAEVRSHIERVARDDVRFANVRVLSAFMGGKFIATMLVGIWWCVTAGLMVVTEIRMVWWLGQPEPSASPDLAALGIVATGAGMAMLVVAPVVRTLALQVIPFRVSTMWQLWQESRRLAAEIGNGASEAGSADPAPQAVEAGDTPEPVSDINR